MKIHKKLGLLLLLLVLLIAACGGEKITGTIKEKPTPEEKAFAVDHYLVLDGNRVIEVSAEVYHAVSVEERCAFSRVPLESWYSSVKCQ